VIGDLEGWAVLGVGALCALVLVLAECLHHGFGVAPEWTRKLVHVLMGLIASAFPWIFTDARSVVFLCAIFTALLGGSLLRSSLPSVHQVERRTAGTLWFPIAVAVVFVCARGRRELYVIPMLVLTLADPAAAIVGRRYGVHRFGRDSRSLEGSLAFLVVASLVLSVALALTTSLGGAASLAWALAIGIVLAGVEAVAPAGSDNLLIPVGAFLMLRAADGGATAALALTMFLMLMAALAWGAQQRRMPREQAGA
jgi:phytol kinase